MNVDMHALSGAYALDALDALELEEFERHLADCAECREEVASLQEVGAELASLTTMGAPPSLRASILREVSQVRPLPPLTASPFQAQRISPASADETHESDATGPGEPRHTEVADLGRHRKERHGPRSWLAAAAAAVVLVGGGVVWHPWAPSTTQGQLTAAEQVVHASDAQRFEPSGADGKATIVRSVSKGKAVIIADGMAPPPEGKVYELWYFHAQGKAVRAGLMPHDTKKVTMLFDGDAATATGAGVTVEPAGGSDQPTSKPIVTVKFT